MPRLLTVEDAKEETLAIAEEDVRRFRDWFSPELDPDLFFKTLAQHCGVPNDRAFQVAIVRACYPTGSFGVPPVELLVDERKQANRLVKMIRKEIAAIASLRKQYFDINTDRKPNFVNASSRLNTRARLHRQNLFRLFTSLNTLLGSPPGSNVAEVFDCVEAVRLKLATTSSSCRFKEAVRDLNRLLDNWSAATHSKQGKRVSVGELDELIGRLGHCHEKITGRPPDAGEGFRRFVEIIVDQLPFTGMTVRNAGDQTRLKKRIQHVLAAGKDT